MATLSVGNLLLSIGASPDTADAPGSPIPANGDGTGVGWPAPPPQDDGFGLGWPRTPADGDGHGVGWP